MTLPTFPWSLPMGRKTIGLGIGPPGQAAQGPCGVNVRGVPDEEMFPVV